MQGNAQTGGGSLEAAFTNMSQKKKKKICHYGLLKNGKVCTAAEVSQLKFPGQFETSSGEVIL